MSLNSRGIAALGAIVVIGAATVGISAWQASGDSKPIAEAVTLTAGTNSVQSEPTPGCWEDGKALDAAAQTACQKEASTEQQKGKLPTVSLKTSDRVGVGVDPRIAKKGWFAFTSGGSQGQATLASARVKSTYSGSVPASTVLAAGANTLVTVVEADPTGQQVYGVWFFDLKNTDV